MDITGNHQGKLAKLRNTNAACFSHMQHVEQRIYLKEGGLFGKRK
jgi:hypothetical protein